MRYLLPLLLSLLTLGLQARPINPSAKVKKPRQHQLGYWRGKATVASRTAKWGMSNRYHK